MGVRSSSSASTVRFDLSKLSPRLQREFDVAANASLFPLPSRQLGAHQLADNVVNAATSGDNNGTTNSTLVTPQSALKVQWRCADCNNTWTARVRDRTDNVVAPTAACPHCAHAPRAAATSSNVLLLETFPEVAVDWDELRNGARENNIPFRDIREVPANSGARVWWINTCCRSPWMESVQARVDRYLRAVAKGVAAPTSCLKCSEVSLRSAERRARTKLAEHEYLMAEAVLSPQQNPLTMNLVDSTTVRWRCSSCNHEYSTALSRRAVVGEGCPSCLGKIPTVANLVIVQRPDVWNEIAAGYSSVHFPMDELTTASPRLTTFVCKTCVEPYTMPMNLRCLHPPGRSACPKCQYARVKTIADARENDPQLLQSKSKKRLVLLPRKKARSPAVLKQAEFFLAHRDTDVKN